MSIKATLIPITIEMFTGDKKELVDALNTNFKIVKDSVEEHDRFFLDKIENIESDIRDIKKSVADIEPIKIELLEIKTTMDRGFALIFDKLIIDPKKKLLTDSET